VPAEEVVVLPGSPNVIMAAERAAELSDKHVLVVPITSQQAGLAAAVAFSTQLSGAENAQAITEAATHLRTGAVARAAREDPQGRFASGDAVGFLEDELVAWGQPGLTLAKVLEGLAEDAELVSVLAGTEAPIDFAEIERMANGKLDVELELRRGGQHTYWWLLVAE
jgi:hypothetical protein